MNNFPSCWVEKLGRVLSEQSFSLQPYTLPLPASYHSVMMQQGYRIAPNSVMMLPGMDLSLIEMGFVMSAATRIR